ncbi:MAG TPA: hypothetical protein VND90_00840 [Terracidiphilus sp.]|nr:hypothetical protein [Terracidiphilus sp.]
MPASMTSFSVASAQAVGATGAVDAKRRRWINREAGRALEILGHAIEYVADEYVHRGGALSSGDGDVQAIQLLMARNREIYFACPVVPTLWERCRGWLGKRAA